MPCHRLKPQAWLGCAAILVDFIGLGMIAPILPSIVAKQSVGNILTAQYLAVVIGQLVVAATSDLIGRRRVIFYVMVFDALLFGSTGFTKNVTALIVLRLLAGFAAPVALGISYVASISFGLPPAKAQLNFAYVGMSFNLGTLIGSATGGLLGADLWLPANLVAGIVPAFVAIWALATEDTAEDRDKWRKRFPAAKAAASQGAPEPAGDPKAISSAVEAPPAAAAAAGGAAGGTSIKVVSCGSSPKGGGMRQLLATPEMLSVLLGFIANGFFQGAFFSLMPVILADATRAAATSAPPTNATTASGALNLTAVGSAAAADGAAPVDTAPVIAGVIIAAAILQIIANIWGVRISLHHFGSHGHSAWVNLACAFLTVAIAALVEVSANMNMQRDGAFVALLGVIYSIAYVPSASSLTVLNQSAANYARRHGAAIGVTTAFCRCLFATAFGLAPAATIALYESSGQRVWVPLAVMAGFSSCAGIAFVYLKIRRGHSDVMPPTSKRGGGSVESQPAHATSTPAAPGPNDDAADAAAVAAARA
jgi:MFS family permease